MALGNIFYFNPTCELAVANGSFSYQPPVLLREMEQDLAFLPLFFCSENDFVLTENKPSERFLQQLKKNGFDLPHFCSLAELESMPNESFNWLFPWGWSPAAHFYLKNLKPKCSPNFKASVVFQWREEHKQLYERSTSLDFLNRLIDRLENKYLITKNLTGQKILNIKELEDQLKKYGQLVIKAPLSSSGRGIQMIRKQELDNARKQWISGVFKHQGYIVAEPLLDKVADFSFQFRIKSKEEIEFLGISFFETNSNGQYIRTFINPRQALLFQGKANFNISEEVNEVAKTLKEELSNSLYSEYYIGWLGIDAMLFRVDGKLLIHPCVEINCRMNMGILAKFLETKVHCESTGKFELAYGSPDQTNSFTSNNTRTEQVILKNGKIYSGKIPLAEGTHDSKFGAYLFVDEPK